MTGTGLKKWSPPNLSLLPVTAAISVIGRDDVLLANTVVLRGRGREGGREREGGRGGREREKGEGGRG